MTEHVTCHSPQPVPIHAIREGDLILAPNTQPPRVKGSLGTRVGLILWLLLGKERVLFWPCLATPELQPGLRSFYPFLQL